MGRASGGEAGRRRRRLLHLGCVLGLSFGLAAACAEAGENGDGGDGPGTGSGGSAGEGGTGGGSIGTGGVLDGTGGKQDFPRIPCDADTPCSADQLCVKTNEGSFCKPTSGDCTSNADCTGDSFCCSGDCRDDGEDAGVCIPFDSDNPVDNSCKGDVAIGVMAPALQCKWIAPPAGDAYPNNKRVFVTPLVADTPYDAGAASEVVFTTSAASKDAGSSGVIRIISGQTCEQLGNVGVPADGINEGATPAIADVDGDGDVEIFVRTSAGTRAYFWDGSAYTKKWLAGPTSGGKLDWDGVSLHDLDDDGVPEVIGRQGLVHDALTGTVLHAGVAGSPVTLPSDPAVGDVDGDGKPELVAQDTFEWTGSGWVKDHEGAPDAVGIFYAYADFGTAGATPAQFDRTALDGQAEIVVTGGGIVGVYTLDGQELMRITGLDRGGAPTISDFDGDGKVEFASAGDVEYRVFDLDCAGTPAGCAGDYVLWTSATKDASSASTGSSVFDFDADGKAEVVYSDECYLRVYEGGTGDVIYSAPRTSCTWWENPTIADPDHDSRTEIIVGMNPNCGSATTCYSSYGVDPRDKGLRCETNEDCGSGNCDSGFCRCGADDECNGDWVKCTTPLAGTPGSGNVCRARSLNPYDNNLNPDKEFNDLYGIRIYRDRLDRWASSRALWNQHAYSVTNVNDDGTVPKTSEWEPNFTSEGLNNFRQNRQGQEAAGDLPDITGVLDQDKICEIGSSGTTLSALVCNRGLRTVGADMPATFYLGDVEPANILCISYTKGPVPEGDCLPVSCSVNQSVPGGSTITMVVNDDGTGRGATSEECNLDNNTDAVAINACVVK